MAKQDLAHLAAILNYTEDALVEIAANVPRYYRPFHLVVEKRDADGRNYKKIRHIDNPVRTLPLRELQKKINKELLKPNHALLDKSLTGGIKKRSITNFIEPHVGRQTIVCMDLTNCFPNITKDRVFNVWKHQLGYSNEAAKLLTEVTTYRGYLPQGAPTSSMLCNFVLNPMARTLRELMEANGLNYTQYIDDICFSGDDVIVRKIINKVYPIVTRNGQKINKKKSEILDSKHKQRTMGITVNAKTKIDTKYISVLVKSIENLETHSAINSVEYLSLAGKILHIKHFDAAQALRLAKKLDAKLLQQYDAILEKARIGEVRACRMYKFDRSNKLKCIYLRN